VSSKNLHTIINLLLELAAGNLTAKGQVSPRNDDYDAIITGINILTEELRSTTVSKEYLNNIYKGIADMLFLLDPEERIKEINEPVVKLLQVEKDFLIGQSFRRLFQNTSSFTKVFSILKKQGYCYDIENNLHTSGDQIIPVTCTASSLKDKNGQINGYLFIAKDISKIKKTEEALKLKNKELDTFLYKAAHDLKSPITSIQGILNIAKMEIQDPAAAHYFELIGQCTLKLDKILVSLKDTVESDISGNSSEAVLLASLIEEVFEDIKKSPYYCERVRIEKKIEQPYPVYTKSQTIHHALYQVVENAYKFRQSSAAAQLILSTQQTDRCTSIIIRDNGIGIQKQYQDKIFDMFYKANSNYEGAGLGLYSAQSVLNKIEGKIKVDSTPKEGSVFTICFPNGLQSAAPTQ
jgi:PAS domain S-box-containing protein